MSSDPQLSISAREVGKAYRIASDVRSTTLGEAVVTGVRRGFRRTTKETFWALHDVSFDVAQGEIVGIIGRNGAGKSTLLKILSRITEPTSGQIQLLGRVGSLLEVGTGFHLELTGRENIYLNGAVLGMRRSEVERHFDSIVEFSGVSRFLDVPVKRYSSGMSVRLAFAVAAHLEPEILLVDEVLAVGDAEFQRRCLGKMGEVASEDARTVLFVSHNMAAIETLCPRSIVLEGGEIHFDGPTPEAITRYMTLMSSGAGQALGDFDLTRHPDRARWGRHILRRLRFVDDLVRATGSVAMGQPLDIAVELEGLDEIAGAFVGVQLFTDSGQIVATFHGRMKPPRSSHPRASKEELLLRVGPLPLAPGRYWLGMGVGDPNRNQVVDEVLRAASFDVIPSNVYGSGYAVIPEEGSIFVDFEWELRPLLSDQDPEPGKGLLDARPER